VFLEHAPAQIERIETALEHGDAVELKAAAHKLKGSCLMVGEPRMASVCAKLEGNPVGADSLREELDAQYRGVRSRFELALAAGATSSLPPRV
jgi:HPt (histidine-containing phosphotransfer) domain-containing protein